MCDRDVMTDTRVGDKVSFGARKAVCASVPCTCGELFQGSLDGEPCLVSCPIDVYSVARVTERETTSEKGPAPGRKVQTALTKLALPAESATRVTVSSPLPAGRGYGTSTADIGAALYAASRAAGIELDVMDAVRIAVSVEPTDSTFLPGLALLDHRQGRFHELLGAPPGLRLLVLDAGGYVDTESFNRQNWNDALRLMAADHRRAYDLLRLGIARGDPEGIGEAATLSARLHETILPNPLVGAARRLIRRVGAVGLCRAHSGTVVGLLFDSRCFDEERSFREVVGSVPRGVTLRRAALVEGGARFT